MKVYGIEKKICLVIILSIANGSDTFENKKYINSLEPIELSLNQKIHKISKKQLKINFGQQRSRRDTIKFELSDAKEPDDLTKQILRKQRRLSLIEDNEPQSIQNSNLIYNIRTPSYAQQRYYTKEIKAFPGIIYGTSYNPMIQQKNNNLPKTFFLKYILPNGNVQSHSVQEDSNSIYEMIPQYSPYHIYTPDIAKNVINPLNWKNNPDIQYTEPSLQQLQTNSNTSIKDSFEDFKDNIKSKYKALTLLVGRKPEEQVKGLTNLILKEMKQIEKRPQDNRAPLLFHPNNVDIDKNHENYSQGQIIKQTKQPAKIYKESIPIFEPSQELDENKSENLREIKGLSSNYEDDSIENKPQYAEQYAFGYKVTDDSTGNSFSHIEKSTDGITKGEYKILLPDGRIQKVRYFADDSGYHAEVSYTTDK